jgi:hypothetical protein
MIEYLEAWGIAIASLGRWRILACLGVAIVLGLVLGRAWSAQ